MTIRAPSPLPDDVIDRLFSALVVRYGSPFLDRWRDLDLAVVKADWGRELAGFGSNLTALRYGLDNLPERPPTVIEFRRICNGAPRPENAPILGPSGSVRGPNAAERAKLQELRGMFPSRRQTFDEWCKEQGDEA